MTNTTSRWQLAALRVSLARIGQAVGVSHRDVDTLMLGHTDLAVVAAEVGTGWNELAASILDTLRTTSAARQLPQAQSIYYTLSGKRPVPCQSVDDWYDWLHRGSVDPRLTVARTSIANPYDNLNPTHVVTAFVGVDAANNPRAPKVFETMTFGGQEAVVSEHCSTWEQAEQQHERAVARVNCAVRWAAIKQIGA